MEVRYKDVDVWQYGPFKEASEEAQARARKLMNSSA